MSKNLMHIEYQGFSPTDEIREHFERIIHEVHEEAPYGARIRAVFARRHRTFRGRIQINSAVGPFFAMARGDSYQAVMKRLLEQMRRRLNRWKSRRFEAKKEDSSYGTSVA